MTVLAAVTCFDPSLSGGLHKGEDTSSQPSLRTVQYFNSVVALCV